MIFLITVTCLIQNWSASAIQMTNLAFYCALLPRRNMTVSRVCEARSASGRTRIPIPRYNRPLAEILHRSQDSLP